MKVKSKVKQRPGKGRYSVLAPKDFHWKILDAYVRGNESLCAPADLKRITGIIRSRDVGKLLDCADDWSPQCMNDQTVSEEQFFFRYQTSSFLKKFPFPGDRESRIETALRGFRDAEDRCRAFNKRGVYKALELNGSETTRALLPRMRKFIAAVLGECRVDQILIAAKHGPGSSLATTKGQVSKYFKYANLPYTVTQDASDYGWSLIRSDERWYNALKEEYLIRHRDCAGVADDSILKRFSMEIVKGNRIEFVPKDARKERTIAIEPLLNLMLQLGVDRHIRRRLKRFQCNLDDQTRNQQFAFEGSVPGGPGFCTLDLSAASDTVSMGVCKLLLPKDWYSFLVDLRSPAGVARGETFSYEKISSMGNGYTFVLESLIFLAAAFAVAKEDPRVSNVLGSISVYGDDIVVPPTCYHRLVELLRVLGFKINSAKSFSSGPFRESCGKDYFRGTLVRPLFLSGGITHVTELFALCNRLLAIDARSLDNGFAVSFAKPYQLALSWLPDKFKRFVGPPSEEEVNTYLHLPVSLAKREGLLRWRWSVYHFKRVVVLPREQSGRAFHFRKLMAGLSAGQKPLHELLPLITRADKVPACRWARKPWDPAASGGNSFAVVLRNQFSTTVVPASSSFWGDVRASWLDSSS